MQSNSPLIRYRKLLVAFAFVIAFGLWYAFRPEKLFINQKVSESAPAGIADTPPLFTGTLRASGSGAISLGRINILKKGNQEVLEISSLQTISAGSLSVFMTSGNGSPETLGTVDPGTTPAQFPLPHPIDPSSTTRVMLVDSAKHTIASTTLEAF